MPHEPAGSGLVRVAVLHGRIALVVDDRAVDAQRSSGGAIP